MSRLYDNGVSFMAEQASDLYKKEVAALEKIDSVKTQGIVAGIAQKIARAKAAKYVQHALQSAEKSFGPKGFHNAALVEWAQQWAQEQEAAKAEAARKQKEYEDIYDLYDRLASKSPKSAITKGTVSYVAEEPYLPRHLRAYNVTVITNKIQLASGSLELVQTNDGADSTTITGQFVAQNNIIMFEASRTTGFTGKQSPVDSNSFTAINFATFNEQYAPLLQPISV